METTDLISKFLPSGMLEHFKITDFKEEVDKTTRRVSFYIYLEENNELPEGYDNSEYESKGFYSEKRVQDFPIRGKDVYLVVKRRRWRLKSDHNVVIKGDYSFIAQGVKLTQEVADFLKGTGRDPRRYDQ